jgi:IS605 OrfB family transposase
VAEVSGVGHKSGISLVFRRLVAPCSDRVESELSSGLPPDGEPRAAARRAGRMGVGPLPMRYSEPKAAFHKSMSGQTFRSNGPFRTESLPYPRLVRRYGLIAVESLNIEGMLKNDRLARSISDAGWSGFLLRLKCKAESAGASVVEVNARGTSQQCSGCGIEVRKELSVRRHACPHCGLSLNRDENAARNILARGLTARIGLAGRNVDHQVKRAPGSRRLQATE